MNYRHIFHAGNICDVVKHSVLALVLDHLRGKDSGFCVLDTHAGIGAYDLSDERATKTGEAKDGILKLLGAVENTKLLCAGYFDVLKKLNPAWDGRGAAGFRYYPGSPLLAVHRLRAQDRLIACELHPEDAENLKRQLFPFKQAQSHKRDGYEGLTAFLPPVEKRGLVLIDPPFEQADEFDRLAAAVKHAYTRWPQGIFMLWYPVKERPAIWRFHEALVAGGMPKIFAAEFVYRTEADATRLNGSGLVLINPPWQMDDKIRALFPALHRALATAHCGDRLTWLAGE